jgi:DinB superfamily
MNVKDAINSNADMALFLLNSYLSDLTDQDLLVRPVPQANHIAWQLGHLIVSTNKFLEFLDKDLTPALPSGFIDSYDKSKASLNDQKDFHSKSTYLDIFAKQISASKQIIERISEAELDKPGLESARSYAPTIGAMLMLIGSHIIMHVGQIVVVRRMLNKSIVM